MYTEQIRKYEDLRAKYQKVVVAPMSEPEYFKYAEVLFSAHSCAIEGNSFSVNDTRKLKEKGLGMIPRDKSLYEAFEILDHFCAFEYMMEAASKKLPLDEGLLKEINRLCTLHTLTYRAPDAIPGEYTTCDIVLDYHIEFPRFNQPQNKASMTLLHYVVSHPAAHPLQMARRRLRQCKVIQFSQIQTKTL